MFAMARADLERISRWQLGIGHAAEQPWQQSADACPRNSELPRSRVSRNWASELSLARRSLGGRRASPPGPRLIILLPQSVARWIEAPLSRPKRREHLRSDRHG